MGIAKRVIGGIFGLVFGVIAALLLAPAAAAFLSKDGTANSTWIMWVVIFVGLLLGVFAPTIRRALGRGFLLVGATMFALPLSTFLLSGRVVNDAINTAPEGSDAAAAIGSGLAGVMMTGAAAFIGFFAGTILLIIGLVLVLGGRREVYVVNSPRIEPR